MIRGLPYMLSIGAIAALIMLGTSVVPEVTVARFATGLAARMPSQRHNALLAVKKLNGAVIQPGETFSFNGRVGTSSRDAGYLRAPVSYNGVLVDSWGGGVCQVSTTLYNAALLAGLDIVERNRHRFAPGYVQPGRDAAVAFSSIDLKFRNPYDHPLRIEGSIHGDMLTVSIVGRVSRANLPQVVTEMHGTTPPRSYTIGSGSTSSRLRNTGKSGFDVATYRVWNDRRERVSVDHYPVMHRIVERG